MKHPQISKDPVADSTDVYAFVSPDAPDTVTLISNYIPLQGPDGGPNFYEFGDDVLYQINIDNNGDGVADVIYQFQFTTTLPRSVLLLVQRGTDLEPFQSQLEQGPDLLPAGPRRHARRTGDRPGHKSPLPTLQRGPLSTPNYGALASQAISRVGNGVLSFAGQRAEGFYVDLGAIFDLGNLRPFQGDHTGLVGNRPPCDGRQG